MSNVGIQYHYYTIWDLSLALKKTKYGLIAKVGEENGATPATY